MSSPTGTKRYGHYWDIAVTRIGLIRNLTVSAKFSCQKSTLKRKFEDIKSSVILIEPTNYNNSAEFEEALFDQLRNAKKKWPNRVIRLNLLDCGDILWVLVFRSFDCSIEKVLQPY